MKARRHTVGYFSSYSRGLECLLQLWPQIRAEVPDATLDIYYGWQSWDALAGAEGPPFKARINALLDELKTQGVTEHGRVSHEELAEAMKRTKVWAYPTEFHEIHCITALKAQEAGCYPVVTNVAALKETVIQGDKINVANIYANEYGQQKFVKAVVKALKGNPEVKPVPGVDWSDVATKWAEVMA